MNTPTAQEVVARYNELTDWDGARVSAFPLHLPSADANRAAYLAERGHEWRHLIKADWSPEWKKDLERYIEAVYRCALKERDELETLITVRRCIGGLKFTSASFKVYANKDMTELAQEEYSGDKDKFPANCINWAKAGRELGKGMVKIKYKGAEFYFKPL